ncbi:MAG TPA: AAA family ATPase [Planctomycetia bacterium]|nr:AAA family ATPase [Planctomycetia bacterium]
MYEAFFDLKIRPFSAAPNPAEYFPAAGHEDGLALLKCFVHDDDGVAVLSGSPGIGKTLTVQRLLAGLKPDRRAVFLAQTHHRTVAELLQAILFELSLDYETGGEGSLRLRLTRHVAQKFAGGERMILALDEAHNLTIEQLEELRLLGNLESRGRKALQVVLVGQPKLLATLERPECEALRQRVAVAAKLGPFESEEIGDYIHACFERAGGSADAVFTAAAIAEIGEQSAGVPRRINQLAHRALLLAFAHQSGTVDAPFVEAAAEQLLMGRPPAFGSVAASMEMEAEAPLSPVPSARPASPPAPSPSFPTSPAHVVEVGADYPSVAAPDVHAAEPRADKDWPAKGRRLFAR